MGVTCRLVALLSTSVFFVAVAAAGEPPRNSGYDTPEELFEAYRQATNNRNWKTQFALGTSEFQDSQIFDIALGSASSDDPDLAPLFAKHGIDLKQILKEVSASQGAKDEVDKLGELAARVVKGATNKAELYEIFHQHLVKRGAGTTTVHEMRNLVQQGSTASCELKETRIAKETRTDFTTGVTSEVPVTFQGTSSLTFRRIDGKWFLAPIGQGGSVQSENKSF